MSSTVLGFREMRQAISDKRLTITTGKDIVKGTTPNNNVHHAYALKRPDGSGSESFNFTFPPLLVSHITKQIPKDSKFASYFVHGDVYGKWPLGKNRGEDPKGDELFDFFLQLEHSYHDCLAADAATRSEIFLHTDQEPMGRNGQRTQITDIMTLINPIIQYPVFRDGHPQQKERDESKSPTFKIKMWDAKITDRNRGQIRPDSLLVNVDPMADLHGDPNDTSRYLQMIYTKIYDLRQARNVMSDVYITKESLLDEFTYMAGDSNKGKSQSTMLATITVLAPSWYWEAKKGASIQFKATAMEIFKKTTLRRANTRTPEMKVNRYQEAMAAIAEYGLDQFEEEEENTDGNCSAMPNSDLSQSPDIHGGNNSVSVTRQLNPSAVVASRSNYKTNPVIVYAKKNTPVVPITSTITDEGSPISDTSPSNAQRSSSFTSNNDHVNPSDTEIERRYAESAWGNEGGEEETKGHHEEKDQTEGETKKRKEYKPSHGTYSTTANKRQKTTKK